MKITDELQEIMDKYDWKSIDDIDWNKISYDYNLSIKFMEKYFDKLNLEYISYYQILSENFIEEYLDEFNELSLYYICRYQKLSEKFIDKYIDKLNINFISSYQNVSKKFAKKHKLDIKLHKKVHRKISYRKKVREVKEYCKKYDLEFDKKNKCFYAYRNHDELGRGMFSNNIFYKKGKYYEDWHLDMRKNEADSFGLGIFPKGNTKVKVLIKDWGLEVNRDDGKCRIWGFEIV